MTHSLTKVLLALGLLGLGFMQAAIAQAPSSTSSPHESALQKRSEDAASRRANALALFQVALDIVERSIVAIHQAQSAEKLDLKSLVPSGDKGYFSRLQSRAGGSELFVMRNWHCIDTLKKLGWLRDAIDGNNIVHLSRFAKGEKAALIAELQTLQAHLQSISRSCIAEAAHYFVVSDQMSRDSDHMRGAFEANSEISFGDKGGLFLTIKTALRSQRVQLWGVKWNKAMHGFDATSLLLPIKNLLKRDCQSSGAAQFTSSAGTMGWSAERYDWINKPPTLYGRLRCTESPDIQEILLRHGLVDLDFDASDLSPSKYPHYFSALAEGKQNKAGIWSSAPQHTLQAMAHNIERASKVVASTSPLEQSQLTAPAIKPHHMCPSNEAPWRLSSFHAGGQEPYLDANSIAYRPKPTRSYVGLLCLPKDFESWTQEVQSITPNSPVAGLRLQKAVQKTVRGRAMWSDTPNKDTMWGTVRGRDVQLTRTYDANGSKGTQNYSGVYLPAQALGEQPRIAGKFCVDSVIQFGQLKQYAKGFENVSLSAIEQHYFVAQKIPLVDSVPFVFRSTWAEKLAPIPLNFPALEDEPLAWREACPKLPVLPVPPPLAQFPLTSPPVSN